MKKELNICGVNIDLEKIVSRNQGYVDYSMIQSAINGGNNLMALRANPYDSIMDSNDSETWDLFASGSWLYSYRTNQILVLSFRNVILVSEDWLAGKLNESVGMTVARTCWYDNYKNMSELYNYYASKCVKFVPQALLDGLNLVTEISPKFTHLDSVANIGYDLLTGDIKVADFDISSRNIG